MAAATAKVLPLPILPLSEQADLLRIEASRSLDPEQRSTLGQYLTPSGIAALMASLFQRFSPTVRLLDAGAGVGSLVSAVVAEVCKRAQADLGRPTRIDAVAYEIDHGLVAYLKRTSLSPPCETSMADVAGSRESTCPGIEVRVRDILVEVFEDT